MLFAAGLSKLDWKRLAPVHPDQGLLRRYAQYLVFSSWWFQPPLKNISQKWESSPNRGEHKRYLKPPPSF